MTGHVRQGNGYLAIPLEVLEEIATHVVGGDTAAGDLEALDLRRLLGHQGYLHLVGGLEFGFQFPS